VTRTLPRTHALLLVERGGERWLADVGFGLEGLLLPIPLRADRESSQHGRRYRLVAEGDGWALQMHDAGSWTDLYAFTLEPQVVADFEMASHYTSTHPASGFVRNLVVQLPGPERRKVLRNRELAIDDGRSVEKRTIAGEDELLDVLLAEFGLRFPAGTRFAVPDAGP
jgi:N-hydroxyarylamine O-acetyltransferase